MSNLLKSLNEKPIGFYRVYKRLTGNTNAALLLSQLMYWFSHKDKFYKTDSDIMEETELTKKELETAKIKLKKLDFLEVTREGIPAKTYYTINWEKYEKSLLDFVVGNKFPQKGETVENTDDKEDNIPQIEAENENGETSFHERGKLDSTKGGNWIPRKGETIYSKIKKTSSKTSSKNILSPKSSLKENELEIKSELIDHELIKIFIAHRKEIKHPMTQQSLNLFIKKLEKLSEKDDPEELVNEAIINGWRSVFPPKANGQNKSYSNPTSSAIRNTFAKLEKLQKEKQNYIEGEIQ